VFLEGLGFRFRFLRRRCKDSPPCMARDLHMFRFMITFTSCFPMGKAHGLETFSKWRTRLPSHRRPLLLGTHPGHSPLGFYPMPNPCHQAEICVTSSISLQVNPPYEWKQLAQLLIHCQGSLYIRCILYVPLYLNEINST
jgi:hypothetical protein